jgi:hypothetical protein
MNGEGTNTQLDPGLAAPDAALRRRPRVKDRFSGRPSTTRLWEDPADMFQRIEPDFDPPTAEAKAARTAAVADGAVPADR